MRSLVAGFDASVGLESFVSGVSAKIFTPSMMRSKIAAADRSGQFFKVSMQLGASGLASDQAAQLLADLGADAALIEQLLAEIERVLAAPVRREG
jgi:hypothetical protein